MVVPQSAVLLVCFLVILNEVQSFEVGGITSLWEKGEIRMVIYYKFDWLTLLSFVWSLGSVLWKYVTIFPKQNIIIGRSLKMWIMDGHYVQSSPNKDSSTTRCSISVKLPALNWALARLMRRYLWSASHANMSIYCQQALARFMSRWTSWTLLENTLVNKMLAMMNKFNNLSYTPGV